MRIVALATLALCGLALGCDKEEKGKATYAQLEVGNDTATTALTAMTPTVFGMKVIGVRALQDLDSTTHPAPIIWYNPECGTATVSNTDVDGKTYEYTQSQGCDITKITTYFDFARPTATVNAELNSQPNKVYPAQYKYVSISFCEGGSVTDNVKFQADGMDEAAIVSVGGCGVTSVEAVPPLEIAEGQTVTVSLAYSLEDIVDPEMGDACWTSADGATKRCVKVPTFTPTIKKS